MKAILVIDIEKDADIKTLRANFEVYGDIRIKPYYQSNYRIGEGVKLKPMPQKMRTDEDDIEEDSYWQGWNACIEELEK